MQRKPWPIIILAFIHFVEPIAKIIFYSILWKMPVSRFLTYMQYQSSPLELFLFLGAFPIAGVAILAVKKWSLPAFFLVQLVTLGGHIYYHTTAPKAFPIYLIVGLTVLNLLVVTYFLLPAVRIAYLDPKVRWWEAKPRFLVDWKGKAVQGKHNIDVTVSNISEGGMFFQTSSKSASLSIEEPIRVDFEFLNVPFSLPGRIRHYSAGSKYGVQFTDLTSEQKKNLKTSARAIAKLDYPRQGLSENPFESFTNWFKTLVKTGKGLVPEVKKLPTKKTQISVGSTSSQEH
jgi:hypothetical protein